MKHPNSHICYDQSWYDVICTGNRFDQPPNLPYLPKLHTLFLNSGKLTNIGSLNLANLPNLRKIVAFANRIRRLASGQLHFQSPVLELVDFSENPLENISSNAIGGKLLDFTWSVTSRWAILTRISQYIGINFNTVLDFSRTNITNLPEETFHPILTVLSHGPAGRLQLDG